MHQAWEAACVPFTADQLRRWLAPMAGAVAIAPPPDEAAKWTAAFVFASGDLPGGVLTPAAQREALRTFKWWPSVAALDAFLRPKAKELWATRDALAQLAKPPAGPALPAPMPECERLTLEEREAVVAQFREKLAAMKAERPATASAISSARPDIKAQRASDELLLHEHEKIARQGGFSADASRVRVDTLRRRLGRA